MHLEFPGEPYPAEVAEKKFDDVVCARIEGSEAEIRLTTDLYVARYPIEEYATEAWGDARPIALRSVPVYGAPSDGMQIKQEYIFQLLVFRRVQKAEDK